MPVSPSPAPPASIQDLNIATIERVSPSRRGDVEASKDPRCPNCDAPQTGPYCARCGQEQRAGRLTTRRFLQDLARRLFDLESGLGHTIGRLTVTPGGVARDYVSGRRARYVRPGTYLVLVSALSILVFSLLEEAFLQQALSNWEGAYDVGYALSGANSADAGPSPAPTGQDVEQMRTLLTWINQGTVYLGLFFAGLFAAVARWLIPGWRTRYNFAESCVFATYAYAHTLLLCLPLYGLILVEQAALVAFLVFLVQAIVFVVGVVQFTRRTWATGIMAGVTFVICYAALMVLTLAGGILTALWIHS